MARCDCCGNEYENAFEVHMNGKSYTFDSFECAIHMLAPKCSHCGCRIVGHGLESGSDVFCCANCARSSGVSTLNDHAAAVSTK